MLPALTVGIAILSYSSCRYDSIVRETCTVDVIVAGEEVGMVGRGVVPLLLGPSVQRWCLPPPFPFFFLPIRTPSWLPAMPSLRTNRQRTQRAIDGDNDAVRDQRRRYRRQVNRPVPRARAPVPWWVQVNGELNLSWRAFWSRTCNHCGTDLLDAEGDSFCCRGGTVSLPRLPEYPEHWVRAMQPYEPRWNQFIRRLNNLYSFTAIGVTSGGFTPAGGAVAITGRVYHRILNPAEGEHSWRWFLVDGSGRTREAERLAIPPEVVEATRVLLEEENPFLKSVRSAMMSTEAEAYTIFLDQPSAGGEIAAVVSAHNLANVRERRIIITRTDGRPTTEFVDIMSPSYEPLQYPLLFPGGDAGWSKKNPFGLSGIDWARARLVQEPRFAAMGPLTCEWAVDMFSRVEEQRLGYLRYGRQDQRRAQYALQQGDARGAGDPAFEVGAQDDEFTLESSIPASFLGSRQWASRQVADSLALARVHGKPSLFITVTTNPRWPEIVDRLSPGQAALDNPALVSRVFHVRLLRFMQFMRTHFQHIVYYVRVTEFQKRGLPHAHILLKVCAPLSPCRAGNVNLPGDLRLSQS